ncbi:transferase [Aureococcus anophagefferens]|nr:transferase [Aureococcus anophagefferens]
MEELNLIPPARKLTDGWRYLKKVNAAGGYENLVRTYRRVLTAPRGCLTRYLRQRFGRDAPHDVALRVLEVLGAAVDFAGVLDAAAAVTCEL